MTVTIVYDNVGHDPRLATSWGFSCLVDYGGHLILMDTGGDPSILLANMDLLGVDPQRIEVVLLSHNHSDHTGGLFGLLSRAHDLSVYLPLSFPSQFKAQVRDAGADVVEVGEARQIMPGVWTTGEVGEEIREQAMVLELANGLVIVTGCAHPGIVSMVEWAKALEDDGTVHLVVGGAHLGGQSRTQVEAVVARLRDSGVQKVALSHCTGDLARRLLAEEYGDDYIPAGVGWTVKIPRPG